MKNKKYSRVGAHFIKPKVEKKIEEIKPEKKKRTYKKKVDVNNFGSFPNENFFMRGNEDE